MQFIRSGFTRNGVLSVGGQEVVFDEERLINPQRFSTAIANITKIVCKEKSTGGELVCAVSVRNACMHALIRNVYTNILLLCQAPGGGAREC